MSTTKSFTFHLKIPHSPSRWLFRIDPEFASFLGLSPIGDAIFEQGKLILLFLTDGQLQRCYVQVGDSTFFFQPDTGNYGIDEQIIMIIPRKGDLNLAGQLIPFKICSGEPPQSPAPPPVEVPKRRTKQEFDTKGFL